MDMAMTHVLSMLWFKFNLMHEQEITKEKVSAIIEQMMREDNPEKIFTAEEAAYFNAKKQNCASGMFYSKGVM